MIRPLCLGVAGLLAALAAPAQTILQVAVPAATPPGAAVYVAGSFNAWQPAAPAYALARQPDGSYRLALPATVRGPQEFKLTRGTWAAAEADSAYRPAPNRRADFGGSGTLRLRVAAWQDQRPGGPPPPPAPRPHTLTGNVQVLADSFAMPQLHGRKRRVWLYLPPGYAGMSLRRYPVLYLQDGQNVFDEATAYSGEWGVDETLARLGAAGVAAAGCIVVAVDNGGPRRLDEYSPWPNAELHQGGEGAAYVDFLAFTLKPYLDTHYRTLPDAAHTGIAGSSMGGLISLYAGLKYPMVFGRVGVFSPATWFAKDSLLAYERRHRPAPLGSRFYFVAGPAESETMLPLMTQARDALLGRGVPASHIRFLAPPDGQHAEWFWRREFGPALEFLMGE